MISLRLTTIEDVDILTDIQQKAFQPLYEKYHDEGNPCLRDKRDILCRLDNPKFLYLTILFDDKIVGGILYRLKGSTPFIKKLMFGRYYLTRDTFCLNTKVKVSQQKPYYNQKGF